LGGIIDAIVMQSSGITQCPLGLSVCLSVCMSLSVSARNSFQQCSDLMDSFSMKLDDMQY